MLMDDQGLILIRDSAMGCYGHRNVCVCVCVLLTLIYPTFLLFLALSRKS